MEKNNTAPTSDLSSLSGLVSKQPGGGASLSELEAIARMQEMFEELIVLMKIDEAI